jgi:hypothetical protein
MRRVVATLAVLVCTAGVAAADNVADLRRQVEYLADALAAARQANDGLEARLARQTLTGDAVLAEGADVVAQALARGIRLVDVNRDLRMVVLNAGRGQGLAPGMLFSVVQGDRAIARVRVVDVRRALAGAVIEDVEWRAFPAPGDRVLAAAATE